jgi:hypothetical protein
MTTELPFPDGELTPEQKIIKDYEDSKYINFLYDQAERPYWNIIWSQTKGLILDFEKLIAEEHRTPSFTLFSDEMLRYIANLVERRLETIQTLSAAISHELDTQHRQRGSQLGCPTHQTDPLTLSLTTYGRGKAGPAHQCDGHD